MQRKRVVKHQYIISIMTVVLLLLLIGIFIGTTWYQASDKTGDIIAHDIEQLATIFKHIHATAEIVNFDYQKNIIDFLTIKKDGFVGSQVGTMNLKFPERWEGPYLPENLKIHGKEYIVVITHQGLFIVPGEGVKLPSGKIMGKDISLDEKSSIKQLMQDEKALRYKGKLLATQLNFNKKKLDDSALILSEE